MKKVIVSVLVSSMIFGTVPQSIYAQGISTQVTQEAEVQINETNFPDSVVREKVKAFDTNGDNKLSQEEREKVKSITWQGELIQDTTGLSNFPNVTYVDLSLNHITKIDLSNFKDLKVLHLENNQLESLDVSNNTNLEVLNVFANPELKGNFDLSNHSKLVLVNIGYTGVENITLPTNSALEAFLALDTPSLKKIVYPQQAVDKEKLTINGTNLYDQERGEEGTSVQWKLTSADGTESILSASDNSISAYGYTAEATWSYNTYNVVYKLPTGVQWKDGEEASAVKKGTYGENTTLPSADSFIIDENYEWNGWTTSKGSVKETTLVAYPDKNDTTITVQPSIVKKVAQPYTIVFEKADTEEEAAQVQGTMASKTGALGSLFRFPKSSYTREGYTFAGWKLESDGKIYDPSLKFSNYHSVIITKSGTIKAVAQWKANTGTIKIGDKTIVVNDEQKGSYTLSSSDLQAVTKEGYQFAGWSYNGKMVTAGESISMDSDGAVVTLTPEWTANEYVTQQMNIQHEIGDQVYTGNPITPEIEVTVEGKTLTEGIDYSVEYSNNINVGVATVTVVPKNSDLYSGISSTFTIKKATMNDKLVEVIGYEGIYDDKEHAITVVTMPAGSSVEYRVADTDQWSSANPTFMVGTTVVEYKITNPNYETYFGSKIVRIYPKTCGTENTECETPNEVVTKPSESETTEDKTSNEVVTKPSESEATEDKTSNEVTTKPSKPTTTVTVKKSFSISGVKTQIYTGKQIKPTVTVKSGSKRLKQGKDYKVTYKNNIEIGKATITVTGLGSYKGVSKQSTFRIIPKITKVSAKTGKSAITVTTTSKSVSGYMIEYKSTKDKTWKKITTKSTKKAIKNLKKGTYTVRVRSYKAVKGVTYYSAYTERKNIKVK